MTARSWLDAAIASHDRVRASVAPLTAQQLVSPSLVAGLTVADVLADLARGGGRHRSVVDGARRGEVRALLDRSPDPGTGDVVADVGRSLDGLEAAWARLPDDRWTAVADVGGSLRTIEELVFRRLREVELHHVDLGLGYSAADWPDAYVAEELRRGLADLPTRTDPRAVVAWLLGRANAPELPPWDER